VESIWVALMGGEMRQRFIDAGGIRTRVLEAGEGGTPLIFLHGTGGHAEAYARNLLAHGKYFHTFAIDMIGHGFTDRPEVDYQLDDFVDHIRAFLGAIGAKSVMLSGESLGAMVVIRFINRYPELVTKAVLNTGMLGARDEKGRGEIRDALERSRAAAGTVTREAVRKRLEWLMHDPAKSVTEELVDVRFKIYTQPGMGPVARKVAEVVLGTALEPKPSGQWDPAQMANIKCPTLVLWSRYNPGRSVEVARESAKIIPNHRMVVLEHSAHWPQWEEADEFNRLHLEFLRT
jgi:2-hydroxy-6-oxonona-2,4-dienedioate hydrolase